ncbi:hypothetical protein SAICODRAFT_199655 [Saitoella complicata NRRL Y-17804]|uniref:uncharacterized protein n=1 Tax=Saitoella complicata (strain BCRC 22490 / CBS 7301 / JCM 7358 / NBRC 10748 / NRRL Y-17804) TaxID=698492 RepID=UPI000866D6A9|nr:uncharacterized protein SAICODRAFT_199655 [Saitoella complicata NRRL Y-17804]ODQ55124.1 hypothetical protein SAICODRAFT_199655 [Saitoella complicata NRRL Y-17804]
MEFSLAWNALSTSVVARLRVKFPRCPQPRRPVHFARASPPDTTTIEQHISGEGVPRRCLDVRFTIFTTFYSPCHTTFKAWRKHFQHVSLSRGHGYVQHSTNPSSQFSKVINSPFSITLPPSASSTTSCKPILMVITYGRNTTCCSIAPVRVRRLEM